MFGLDALGLALSNIFAVIKMKTAVQSIVSHILKYQTAVVLPI